MHALTQWWTGLNGIIRWGLGILATIVFYLIAYAVVATAAGEGSTDVSLLVLAFVGLPLLVLGFAIQIRRLGGWRQFRMYQKAYKSGTVADGARVDLWLPQARKQARYFQEGRLLLRIFYAGLSLLILAVGVIGFAADGRDPGWLQFAALAVVSALVGWVLDRLWGWRARQFNTLSGVLESSESL